MVVARHAGEGPILSPATPESAEALGAAAEHGFVWPPDRPGERGREPGAPARRGWQDVARTGVLALGSALSLWVYLAPLPPGLSPQGKTAGAVFALCTTLWITNALPIGITGLLAVALVALGGVMPSADTFAAFGNSAVFFILGVFILAAGISHSGLGKRLALLFLIRFGRSPALFMTGLMLTAALTTVFMPAQATAAMLFPVAFEVARAMRLRPGESAYGKVLFLALAWGAMVGSNASFLGSTRAALALGMLREAHGATITFAQWMAASLPLVVLGALAVPLVLRLSFPREKMDFGAARAVLESAVAGLGRMNRPQVKVGGLVGATILA